MEWVPSHVRRSICNKCLKETKKTDRTLVEKPTLWLNLPYLGKSGQFLVNNLEKKLNKSLSDFKLKVMYKTNKLAMFCSNKDKLNPLNKANVVYSFTCPGCSKTYIGKTERNLITRLEEHVEGRESAINLHLNVCSSYHDTLSLFKILYDKFNFKMHLSCVLSPQNNHLLTVHGKHRRVNGTTRCSIGVSRVIQFFHSVIIYLRIISYVLILCYANKPIYYYYQK